MKIDFPDNAVYIRPLRKGELATLKKSSSKKSKKPFVYGIFNQDGEVLAKCQSLEDAFSISEEHDASAQYLH